MKKYKYRFMDDSKREEVEELLQGEHGEAVMAWGMECGNAGIEGCKDGLKQSALLSAALVGVVYGAVRLGRKIIRKRNELTLDAESVVNEVKQS